MKEKVLLLCVVALHLATVLTVERKTISTSFQGDTQQLEVALDSDLSTVNLGPEPKAAKSYSADGDSEKTVSLETSDHIIQVTVDGAKPKKGKKKKKHNKDEDSIGGYMDIKMDDAPVHGGKMYTIPHETFIEPGTLGIDTPLKPSPLFPEDNEDNEDNEGCTENCDVKPARPQTIAGPVALSAAVGDLHNGMVKVPDTETEASAPSSIAVSCGCHVCPCDSVQTTISTPATHTHMATPASPTVKAPCGCSTCPCESPPAPTPATSCGCHKCPCPAGLQFVTPAPPLSPLQSCGCNVCPCKDAVQSHSPCGCEECPCPAVHHVPPVCGCSVCPCPPASCGCAVCPCSGPVPFPQLLTPGQSLALSRALGAPVLPSNCVDASCPQYVNPTERIAKETEVQEEANKRERERERHKLHEEMFKHQANFNAISRLSRQLRFEYAKLREHHMQLRTRIVNNKKALVDLMSEPPDAFDIDAPVNNTAKIRSKLSNFQKKEMGTLKSSQITQQRDICVFMGMDRDKCEQRAKALAEATSAANATTSKMRFRELPPLKHHHIRKRHDRHTSKHRTDE